MAPGFLPDTPAHGDQDPPAGAVALVAEGRALQLAGRLDEAAGTFADAVDAAEATGERRPLAEAFRRLGIVHHLLGHQEAARDYCSRSRAVADQLPDPALAAEAIMALAIIAYEHGRLDAAEASYREARDLGAGSADLTARIEQNLGILAAVRGDLGNAAAHHRQALAGYEEAGNVAGCAMAHHNLGMIHADRKEWPEAVRAYQRAASLARQAGDRHLEGLCQVNWAETDLANARYAQAQERAEAALLIFRRLGARLDEAEAYRVLGTVLWFRNRVAAAESRLRSALDIAVSAGWPLGEAEACRDLAALQGAAGQRQEALSLLERGLDLFRQLGAERDVADLLERRAALVAA